MQYQTGPTSSLGHHMIVLSLELRGVGSTPRIQEQSRGENAVVAVMLDSWKVSRGDDESSRSQAANKGSVCYLAAGKEMKERILKRSKRTKYQTLLHPSSITQNLRTLKDIQHSPEGECRVVSTRHVSL